MNYEDRKYARQTRRSVFYTFVLIAVLMPLAGAPPIAGVIFGAYALWALTRPLERFMPVSRGDMILEAFDREESGRVREVAPTRFGRRRFEEV